LLEGLKARERAVVVRRFGLEGHRMMTLEEIGGELGCTRERVRQLQEDALKRMRRAFTRRQSLQFLNVVLNPPPAPHREQVMSACVAA
jgi:DNA-directed RNA polymerase sigma subunit (sigma70/sigma32)